jgi:class III poly(R)-hydroxyalkanoic acid synthase PhaE subunit
MAEAAVQPAGSAPASFFQPQELSSANEAFASLWKSALEISQSITRTMDQGKKPDPLVSELMSKLFDPRAWFSSLGGMDEALQRMAEGPRLADLWDTERKLIDVFNAWTALRQRSIEHNTVMLEAWTRAAGSFAKTLNARADRKETLGSWREVLALWVETANTALLETQRSEKYLESQREILKASTQLRLAQQALAAFYSEVFGYPTRAELDDVHRTVTELRRELRALQRESATRKASKPRRKVPKPIEVRSGT